MKSHAQQSYEKWHFCQLDHVSLETVLGRKRSVVESERVKTNGKRREEPAFPGYQLSLFLSFLFLCFVLLPYSPSFSDDLLVVVLLLMWLDFSFSF